MNKSIHLFVNAKGELVYQDIPVTGLIKVIFSVTFTLEFKKQ